ncbi:MAG: hypothetical protein QXX95_04845 [Nitrososphaerales archaeon]
MSFSDEELKRLAEIKVWLEERIKGLEAELNRTKDLLAFIDSSLKRKSFVQASELVQEKPQRLDLEYQEAIPLKRSKDGKLMAHIYVSQKRLALVPVSDLTFQTTIPPFKSFFVNKVLEGMKSKDLELSKSGKLKEDEVFSYTVEEENNKLLKVIIENYRDKSRLNEIVNTATWTFTRVLEKMEG